ncbi:unnamed protein product [marine sediment metagenome]|uniref:DUF4054 domain-containing protein n=1 Tax=marine sediment metagenome TaxID=412755 RepID=X1FB72_9ZZZZ
MSTPLEIITIRAPAFALESNINDLITEAELEVSTTEYNTSPLRNKAVALIVMHWIALNKRDSTGGTAGAIKSEKEGDLSRSFGATGNNEDMDPYYGQTTWGLEFLRLQVQCFIKPTNRMV